MTAYKKISDLFEPVISLTIQEKFDCFNATIISLRDELKVRDEIINKLQSENIELKQDVTELKKSNNALEQFTRKDNLVLTGISASYAERAQGNENNRKSSVDTIDKVAKLCTEHMNCNITASDISVAHRLSGSANAQILGRFVRRSVRDEVYNARFNLKKYNSGRPVKEKVFINEDLSSQNRSIFSAAWKAKGRDGNGIESVFTRKCQVFAKVTGLLHPIRVD